MHGFAFYALMLAKNIGELKAISQNLMHSNISITDGIYGGLSGNDIKSKIINLENNYKILDNFILEEWLKIAKQIVEQIDRGN